MKKENLIKYLFVALLLVVITSVSSCNRGIGCPGEFSMQQDISCIEVE